MKIIEHINSKNLEELKNSIIDNMKEFDLSKLYSKEVDYKEAIAIITQKQIILLPVYISHPMVALKVLSVIIPNFSFDGDIRMMHTQLMESLDKFFLAIAYIEENRTLNILTPNGLNRTLGDNIKNLIFNINCQTFAPSLIVSIGNLNYKRFDINLIFDEINKITQNTQKTAVDENILLSSSQASISNGDGGR